MGMAREPLIVTLARIGQREVGRGKKKGLYKDQYSIGDGRDKDRSHDSHKKDKDKVKKLHKDKKDKDSKQQLVPAEQEF